MLAELKRPTYVTPTNYLELVYGYLDVLKTKVAALEDLISKYAGGTGKLDLASDQVAEMSEVLAKKQVEVCAFP